MEGGVGNGNSVHSSTTSFLVTSCSRPLELALQDVGMWEDHLPGHSWLRFGETLEAGGYGGE